MCNFNSFLKDYKILSRVSSGKYIDYKKFKGVSNQLIIFGKFNVSKPINNAKNEVVIKIGFDSDKYSDTNDDYQLMYERYIYKNVTNKLVLNHNTPNIVLSYGEIIIDCIDDNYIKKIIRKDIKKLYLLVLEKSGNKSLDYYLNRINDNELFGVVFQILWTLKCFSLVGLIHHDLHLDNIRIEYIPKGIELLYYLPTIVSKNSGKIVKIKTKYVVKIFDFDRATKFETKANNFTKKNVSLEEYCKKYCVCNDKYSNFDLYTILYILKLESENKKLRNWCSKYLKNFKLDTKIKAKDHKWLSCTSTNIDILDILNDNIKLFGEIVKMNNDDKEIVYTLP